MWHNEDQWCMLDAWHGMTYFAMNYMHSKDVQKQLLAQTSLFKVPIKWKNKLLKKGLIESHIKAKKDGIFLFVQSSLLTEI